MALATFGRESRVPSDRKKGLHSIVTCHHGRATRELHPEAPAGALWSRLVVLPDVCHANGRFRAEISLPKCLEWADGCLTKNSRRLSGSYRARAAAGPRLLLGSRLFGRLAMRRVQRRNRRIQNRIVAVALRTLLQPATALMQNNSASVRTPPPRKRKPPPLAVNASA